MIKVKAIFAGTEEYENKAGQNVKIYNFSVYPFYDSLSLTERNLSGFNPQLGSTYVIELSAFYFNDKNGNTRASIGGKVVGSL